MYFFQLENKICKVVDVILNPKIVEEMQKDNNFMAMVMNLFEFYFEEKHKLKIKGSNIFKRNEYS